MLHHDFEGRETRLSMTGFVCLNRRKQIGKVDITRSHRIGGQGNKLYVCEAMLDH